MYLGFTNLQLGLKYELNLIFSISFWNSILIKSQYLVLQTSIISIIYGSEQ